MKLFAQLKDRIIYKLLQINNLWYDEEDENEWLAEQWHKKGFKSYIRFRDISLLKSIAVAVEQRDFQKALELNGRRMELLKLSAKAKEEHLKQELKNK